MIYFSTLINLILWIVFGFSLFGTMCMMSDDNGDYGREQTVTAAVCLVSGPLALGCTILGVIRMLTVSAIVFFSIGFIWLTWSGISDAKKINERRIV